LDDVFPVALLRIAMALKRRPESRIEAIVEETVKAMGLPRRRFQSYLAEHMTLLSVTAKDFERANKRVSRREPAPAVVEAVAGRRRVKARSPR
jgi:hypothetical protein